MPISLLLFDLDGTLIDSYKDIGLHLNKTLKDFGLPPVHLEEVKHMIGGGARELLRKFFSDDLLEEALTLFREYYTKEPVIYTKPFEGIQELLSYAKGLNINLAVITNKMEGLSKAILKELGLLDYFSLVVGGDTFKEKKPSPLPILEVIKAFGVPPSEVLMVGDTETDMIAGALAGVRRGLALWGYVRLEKEKPDFFFERPSNIIDLLRNFNEFYTISASPQEPKL